MYFGRLFPRKSRVRWHRGALLALVLALLAGVGLAPQGWAQGTDEATSPDAPQAAYSYENTTSGAIADNQCVSSLSRTFNVTDAFTINDLNVGFNADHTYRGDLRVTLQSPLGTSVQIIATVGDSDDGYDLLLDSASANPLDDGSADPTGAPYYARTAAPSNSLNAFNGQQAFGTWTLSVCDAAALDTGTFNRARLDFDGTPQGISGTVFRDYDADGVLDSNEPGVHGVTVTAYDSAGTVQGTTTTAASGTYTFNPTGSAPYRIEFTGYPSYLYPGPAGGSSVQFLPATNTGNVNFGLNAPSEYCQANPNVCTVLQAANEVNGQGTRTDPLFYVFPYTASGDTGQHTVDLPANAMGATWGVAVQPTRSRVFLAAMLKRHAGLGPRGLDGVYITDYAGSTVTGFDLQGITPGNGGAAIDLGSVTRTGGSDYTLPVDPTISSVDLDAFGKVGAIGFGDADISEDGSFLWLVNLNQKALVRVDVSAATVTPSSATVNQYAISAPACTGGTFRPWGLKFANGLGYVGVTCDAGTSQNRANLTASVLSFDPANPGAGFTTRVTFGVNYTRERIAYSDNTRQWQAWASTWAQTGLSSSPDGDEYAYPQPLVGDIEFADDGDMVIGIVDRWAHQTGYENYVAVAGSSGTTDEVTGNSGGDTVHACWNPAAGTYTVEGPAACPESDPGGADPLQNNDGPSNGGEYYYQDYALGELEYHAELGTGALARLAGQQEVTVSAFDAIDEDFSQGIHWYSTPLGFQTDAYELLAASDPNSFGKAGNFGDLELLCNLAPIEIGNRVWRDQDGDGVQDAGEQPLAGVTVQLYQGGTLLGTAVTTTSGAYLFSNRSATDVLGADYGITQLVASGSYEVRIAPAAGSNGTVLTGLGLTTANASTGTGSDLRDSDATLSSGNFAIPVTAGLAGQNNHTYDFGFAPLGALGNRVWLDEDSNGVQDEGEPGIANVTVTLFNSAGTVLGTTTTNANGEYLFPDLPAGSYFVQVTAGIPAGLTQTTIYPGANTDLVNQDQTTGANDYGYGITLGVGDVNLTGDFGYNWNPTGDVNSPSAGAVTAALGDRVWVDFDSDGRQDPEEIGIPGVDVQLVTAGTDGLFGTGDDVVAATTTTDNTGLYLFDGLAPGAYVARIPSGQPELTGYTQTGDPDHFGATDTSPANNDGRTTVPVVLGPGDVFLNADFGYVPSTAPVGSIGNRIWLDLDADSIGPTDTPGGTDTTEVGISGVTVALIRDLDGDGTFDAGEPIIATDVTDATGFYLFSGLPVTDGTGTDDYIVWVNDASNALEGLTGTYEPDDTSPPITTSPGFSAVANLTTTAVLTQDFGYTYDNSGTGGSNATTLPLPTGAELAGRLGDRVWLDVDSDDTQDADEPGIPGVTVVLTSNGLDNVAATSDDIRLSTVTGANGLYLFDNLPVDADGVSYTVQVQTSSAPLAGLSQTYDATNPQTDSTSSVSLTTAAPVNLLQDFGYVGTGTVGNFVWNDQNGDGNFDAGEPAFGGVTLALFWDANGNGALDPADPLVDTTATDASGLYQFPGLSVNDGGNDIRYFVDVTDTAGVLAGYHHTIGTAGSDNHSQDDDGYAVVLTPTTTSNQTADFGYQLQPAALGNRVWNDFQLNGLQDAGEAGIAGVAVELAILYPNGTVVTLRTLTDANGYYGFANLLQDEDYQGDGAGSEPTFTGRIPSGQAVLAPYTETFNNVGGNDLVDADPSSGVSALPVEGSANVPNSGGGGTAGSEPVIASYDFGYYDPLSEQIASFTAEAQPDHILVLWETVSELDNVGFNLYRDVTDAGPGARLNEALIPSQAPGSSQGFPYQWVDATAEAGTTYFYWLETVATNGNTLRYGPVSATINPPTAVTLTDLQGVSTPPALGGVAALALTLAALGVVLARRARR